MSHLKTRDHTYREARTRYILFVMCPSIYFAPGIATPTRFVYDGSCSTMQWQHLSRDRDVLRRKKEGAINNKTFIT